MNVKNLSDVVTFVDTGFDKSKVPLVPPSPTAPESKTDDGKNDHSEKYTHHNPCDSTLWNARGGGWTAKGAVGNPETCYKKREYLHWRPRNGGSIDVPYGEEGILCIRDDQGVGMPRIKSSRVKQHSAFFPGRLCSILCRLSIKRNVVTAGNGISEAKDRDGSSYSTSINRSMRGGMDKRRLPLNVSWALSPNCSVA